MVYIGGYNPIAMLEALMNLLIQKGLITTAEEQEVVEKAKAPGS